MSTEMQSMATAEAAAQTLGVLAADQRMRPFKGNVSRQAVEDLRRRISATQLPDRETVEDSSLSCLPKRSGRRSAPCVDRAE